jgi:hypothetical protein
LISAPAQGHCGGSGWQGWLRGSRSAALFGDSHRKGASPPLAMYSMPRRPAAITQADIARAIRAAKQEGATEVEVRIGERLTTIVIRLVPSADEPLAQREEIIL